MGDLRNAIAKTIYESDTSLRHGPGSLRPTSKYDAPFESISGPLLWQYHRNAEHVVTHHVLSMLDRIAEAVAEIENGNATIAAHNLDAILEDYDYGELRKQRTEGE